MTAAAHHTSLRLAVLCLSAAPWMLAPALAAAPQSQAPATVTAPATVAPRSGKERRKPAAQQKIDHMQLGTTTVTGNRELPKVMYIVPWKKSDIGDLGGKPMNSLLDEVLAPVDRDVFRREVGYYHALTSAAPASGAKAATPAGQGEK